jgi:hypothetical protein
MSDLTGACEGVLTDSEIVNLLKAAQNRPLTERMTKDTQKKPKMNAGGSERLGP